MAVVRPVLADSVTGFTTLKVVMEFVLLRVDGGARQSAGTDHVDGQACRNNDRSGHFIMRRYITYSRTHAGATNGYCAVSLYRPVTTGHRLALPGYAGTRSPAIRKYLHVLRRR